jgi:hypothetical protein
MPVAGTDCPGWNFSAVSLALGIAPTYATLPMRPLDAERSWKEVSGASLVKKSPTMPINNETLGVFYALSIRNVRFGDYPYEFKPSLANHPACAVDYAPKISIDSSLPPASFSRDQLPVLRGTRGRGPSFLLSRSGDDVGKN